MAFELVDTRTRCVYPHYSFNINIQVININGSLVLELANSSYSAGEHEFIVDLDNPGIYFIKVIVDNNAYVKKIIRK